MKMTGICLLLIYAIIRFLPFLITASLVAGVKTASGEKQKKPLMLRKGVAILNGVIVNAILFMGMHYYHYKDLAILGYVKNVGGLNFYHKDVEYFAVSAAAAIGAAIVLGIFLRTLFFDENIRGGFGKKQQAGILAAGFCAFVILILGFGAKDYFQSQIVIGEICSNNESYAVDGNEQITDYIELQNVGKLPCQIEDLYLSDDAYALQKLPLAGYVLPAGGVVVIPCVDDINSFSISNRGEEIYLSNGAGQILEQITLGGLDNDTAYTKTDLKENTWEVTACTPGITYEASTVELVAAPVLSKESGFYDTEFDLVIESAPDTTVYYTLDGSVPDEGSYLYEGAIHVYDKSSEENVWNSVQNIKTDWEEYEPDMIPVTKAFLIRAAAVDQAGNRSDVVTASYFIGQEDLKNKNVVSLVAAPEDLFGGEKGIYVTGDAYDTWYLNGQEGDTPTPHFKEKGMEWEREAVFELFEPDKRNESVLQQSVGIRIRGASTRNAEDKRFSVFARLKYGSDTFAIPLFDVEREPASFIIHTSFIDAVNQELMEGRNIPNQNTKIVSLFLNGEFWYEGYLREKYDKDYFEDYYGIDGDNLILYKAGEMEEGVGSDRVLYQELYDYVEGKEFSQDSLYEELTQKVDVQNYIEFLSANIYCANMDVDDTKNVVMFRAREAEEGNYNDGKWRFVLYDMDAVDWTSKRFYEIEEEAALDSFSQQPRYADMPYNQGTLYKAFRQNEQFCKQFVLTFMDLLNTSFTVENAAEKLEKYGFDITYLNSFFEKRPEYMKTYLAKEFELTGSVERVTIKDLDETKGYVTINTIDLFQENGQWSGEYFTDYPVTVTAHPWDGYEFVGWSGSVEAADAVIEVPVTEGGIELKAEFRKIEE